MTNLENLIASSVDAPAFFDKESKLSDYVALNITSIDLRQTRDVKRKTPEVWSDGSPKQQLVITGVIADSSTGGKEGERVTVYVKWWGNQRKGFATAIVDAGEKEPKAGGLLRIDYTGNGEKPADKTLSPEKLYTYSYNVGQAEQWIG